MYTKRKQLTKGKILVFAIVGVFAVIYMISVVYQSHIIEQPANASVKSAPRQIVIDAGHGGADGGAVGVNGEVEKEINLKIALTLRDMLESVGFETIMTREEDISIHDKKYEKLSQQKTSDIKNRLKIIEEYPQGICVSIHQNHFSEEKYHGAQMFYGVKNPQSPLIAQFIQQSFVNHLQPDNQRQIKEGTNSIYLLKNATVPIVLVECGFLSNEEEGAMLSNEEYQQKTAFAVFCGIIEYYNADNRGMAKMPEYSQTQ